MAMTFAVSGQEPFHHPPSSADVHKCATEVAQLFTRSLESRERQGAVARRRAVVAGRVPLVAGRTGPLGVRRSMVTGPA